MIVTQHAHIYRFLTSKFNFGEIFFLIFLSIPPLSGGLPASPTRRSGRLQQRERKSQKPTSAWLRCMPRLQEFTFCRGRRHLQPVSWHRLRVRPMVNVSVIFVNWGILYSCTLWRFGAHYQIFVGPLATRRECHTSLNKRVWRNEHTQSINSTKKCKVALLSRATL